MYKAKMMREASLEVVESSDESDFEEVNNNNKIAILSILNEKLDLLLTKFDKMETSIHTLQTTVDTLLIKQTTIDTTVCELLKDKSDKSASIINTENCCTKILEIIGERALSFESAIQHASNQIKEQVSGSIPCSTDTTQSTDIDDAASILLQQPKSISAPVLAVPTSTEIIPSANELLYSLYKFESSSSCTPKRQRSMNFDSDESPISTPISVGSQIIFTDPNTKTTFHVMKEKHDRQQLATNQELLKKETGFRHLLAYLFSTLFTEEELRVSSVDASVRGTQAFDPVRVGAIDRQLFDLYEARYAKFRTSNQYKEILNKKCSRIRSKFNKNMNNY
ncbi:unnamed protein product [Rotaria sp. Silwood2]|nr:unnamed protein product [Rotaria sp. Silwood2]CAF2905981.1 unnamed protein product [Rotaria sp. Silwood2]CAF3955938.1 unnamed protein product [Rotaria sp. Silwood2]CAF4148509.1 unnamed protein product [Rotaria sp. Silwood2]